MPASAAPHKLDYVGVQNAIDDGTADENLALLKEIGLKRIALEIARGAANLTLPDTEVTDVDDGSGHPAYQLVTRSRSPSEDWNAQLSLMTGMAAAELMIGAKVGHPAHDARAGAVGDRTASASRPSRSAHRGPTSQQYGEYLRALDTTDPKQLAIMHAAGALFRGAGYTAFDGDVPVGLVQAAVGHVVHARHRSAATTRRPLRARRLRGHRRRAPTSPRGRARPCRRCPASWQHSSGHHQPVRAPRHRHRRGRRAVQRVGDVFDATVISLSKTGGSIQLTEPAVTAHCNGALVDGSVIRARLVQADIPSASVVFELVP